MSSIWHACLSHLENEISSHDLNTWIRPLQAQEDKEFIKLFAPNQFIINHVIDNFLGKIEDAVYQFSSGQYKVRMGIGSIDTEEPAPEPAPEPVSNPLSTQVTATPQKKTKQKKEPAKKAVKTPNFINKAFTFENFVVGKTNQLAQSVALQTANKMGGSYNPLLIYGASGLGKTHLMHAIGNDTLDKNPNANILYLHAEKFVREMVKAFQQDKIDTFKNYFRGVDALFIDDVQFLAGKQRSQEEFLHIFNSLIEGGKQIVLTCDRYPKEIKKLDERLKSRFSSGLPAAIDPPDLETRTAILLSKAAETDVKLDEDVARFIAERIPSNVRDLEGALRRVIANSKFTGEAITIKFSEDALYDLMSISKKVVNIELIQQTVADYFEIKLVDLLSQSRKQSLTRPRQIAMLLARELTSHSLPEIGKAFSGRDHTTVMSACKRVQTLCTTDYQIQKDYTILTKRLS